VTEELLDDDEVEQLAWTLALGEVWIDFLGLTSHTDLQLRWVPFGFAPVPAWTGAIYEKLSAAGSRTINGMPMFFSLRVVHIGSVAAVSRPRSSYS